MRKPVRRFTPEQYDTRRGVLRVDSKLTEADVLEIRALRGNVKWHRKSDPAISLKALAARFNVSTTVISHVANRKSWTHIP